MKTKEQDIETLEYVKTLAYSSMSPQQLESFESLLDYLKERILNRAEET